MKSLLLPLFLILCLAGAAQDSAYQSVLNRWQREHGFSGTVLVSRGGRLLWSGAVGHANRETSAAAQSTTPYRIAGLTQPFTAVMILQLKEEGKLALDDTIAKYLPGYTGPGRARVTIRQLLTYSSGIPECGGGTARDIDRATLKLDTFISRYCSGPLEFEPGTKARMGNGDYILLGKIIEQATGRTWVDNLERRILRPLRMNSTGVVDDSKPVPRLARSYNYKDSATGYQPDKPYYTGNYYSAGSLYSTAYDLMRFDAALFAHQLLRPGTLADMIHGNEKLGNVAQGVWASAGRGSISLPYIYGSGAISGSRANWIHVLKGDIAVLVLSNTNRGDLARLSEDLYTVAVRK
ncbi:class A beta-lactamase-related serine hydrolase [Flaviaesturariibacter flavus]|uniref:Class A beta-lactamase-related serine hydrolase n=1 Tax=Flaviaesturariibacter flavus TaxID=2502780 RepID=A0A4R1B7U3_9BACT|nr:serine hydrolase domain-containing protein [Flaviaesturariibacter flavus]TCJ13227.1 class A beta-lactamase-related serine hydrolase [Flaviaesturariibacter flavus]